MTLWTVARQAFLSMKFSRQEYWSGLPIPSPGDLPNPGIKPVSPALQVNSLPSEPPGKPHKDLAHPKYINKVIYTYIHKKKSQILDQTDWTSGEGEGG